MTFISSRASALPRQKCAPNPNATWSLGWRLGVERARDRRTAASSKLADFVEQHHLLPRPQLARRRTSVSSVTVRHMFLIGDTQRSISSTATGMPAGSSTSARRWSGCAQQLLHAAADHVPCGLVAADEDQQRLVEHFVVGQPVAVDLGVHEHAHQVVGRRRLPRGDRAAWRTRCIRHGCRRGDELLLGRVAALRAHHVVRPAQQVVAVLGRHAEHVADHDHRQRRGEVAHEVALAPLAHPIDERVARCRGAPPRCRARGVGVKPRLTSLRRFQCAGSSMSIIIGSGPESGRMPPAFENVDGSFDAASTAA